MAGLPEFLLVARPIVDPSGSNSENELLVIV